MLLYEKRKKKTKKHGPLGQNPYNKIGKEHLTTRQNER